MLFEWWFLNIFWVIHNLIEKVLKNKHEHVKVHFVIIMNNLKYILTHANVLVISASISNTSFVFMVIYVLKLCRYQSFAKQHDSANDYNNTA